jgi:hypothetical protein
MSFWGARHAKPTVRREGGEVLGDSAAEDRKTEECDQDGGLTERFLQLGAGIVLGQCRLLQF